MENKQFFDDLWVFIASKGAVFPKALIKDLYEVGRQIQKGDENGNTYDCLCWCAKDAAKSLKEQLPDYLHSRMILGTQNKHTVEYIKKLKKWQIENPTAQIP